MQGKKARFGTTQSTLWAQATKAASNGSVSAIQDGFRQIGKVIFGGVSAGFHGLLLYLVVAVFLARMMVGRTPEYLGKKAERRDVTLAAPVLLWVSVGILIFGTLAATMPFASSAMQDSGPHGRSKIRSAYNSATGNNGRSLCGLWGDGAVSRRLERHRDAAARLCDHRPAMRAMAGSRAVKTPVPATARTFPTHGPMFVARPIPGALTLLSALVPNPIAAHVSMLSKQNFWGSSMSKLPLLPPMRNTVIFATAVVALMVTIPLRRDLATGAPNAGAAGLTLTFLLMVALEPFARHLGSSISVLFPAVLFVTLIPIIISGLLSAIGIAGMDSLARANHATRANRS